MAGKRRVQRIERVIVDPAANGGEPSLTAVFAEVQNFNKRALPALAALMAVADELHKRIAALEDFQRSMLASGEKSGVN